MNFNESNAVEAYIRALLAGPIKATPANRVQEPPTSYGPNPKGIGWHYAAPADVPRQIQDVLVEPWLREALLRLNPEIAAQPDRADEVLYKLRAIVLSVRADGLIRANEEMTAWMRGERSMPFGANHEHVPVRLIDLDDLSQNQYILTQQFSYRAGPTERRADLVACLRRDGRTEHACRGRCRLQSDGVLLGVRPARRQPPALGHRDRRAGVLAVQAGPSGRAG